MKVTNTAVSILTTLPFIVSAQERTCSGVDGSFKLSSLSGPCTYDTLLEEYTRQVYDVTGNTCSAGSTVTAQVDLDEKLMASTGLSSGEESAEVICKMMYDSDIQTPFTYAADQDTEDPTMNFEQQFYNGLTKWQDEVETLYESTDGTPTSVLREDASKVREFYIGDGSYTRLEWPNQLTNFEDSTCTMNAAMCCWPKDRQANDGNGNCDDPYDENCVNKDVADNTNLCFADLSQGEASSHFTSDGFAVFPEDNDNGEGAIHCHGFAWADDEYETTSRYRSNNLFFVSMYDHMYQRGYVKNIPGMPMCGCMDQMPTVTRSDCTQVDLTEEWDMEYNGSNFTGKLIHIEIDFNACQGRNNRNNDLWAYSARLYDEGRMSAANFGTIGRKLTNDHDCYHSTEFNKQLKGYTTGYEAERDIFTKVAGRDNMYSMEPMGKGAFDSAFFDQTLTAGTTPIIMRVCPGCKSTHRKIFYRRLTNITDPEFDLLHNILYERNNGNGQNVFDEDFTLHSSYSDAVTGDDPWTCDEGYNYGALFDGECSPDGTRTRDQYSKFDWFPGKSAFVFFCWPQPNVAYFINKPSNTGFNNTRSIHATASDIGSPSVTGNTLVDGDVYYVQGGGTDIWNQKDQFHYYSEPSETDDIDVSVHLSAFSNNGDQSWAKAGLMLRSDTSDNAVFAFSYLTGSNGVDNSVRRSKGAYVSTSNKRYKTEPAQTSAWLRIVKKMETVEFYHKANEADEWTLQATEEVFFPNNSYRVGLAVTSHYSSHRAEGTFEDFVVEEYFFPTSAPSISTAPTPWQPNVDIGEPQRDGEAYYGESCECDVVKGSGREIWGSSDSFFFVNDQFASSSIESVEMQIQKFDNWRLNSRGGLMMRSTNDDDSSFVFVGGAGRDQGVVLLSRPNSGAPAEHHKMVYVNNKNSMWVKLAKNGTDIMAYHKEFEGDEWIELGTASMEMETSIQVGKAVTAGSDDTWALETMETRNYNVTLV